MTDQRLRLRKTRGGLSPRQKYDRLDLCEDCPRCAAGASGNPSILLRKEVIQPHLPVRLPCYDLVLITDPTFDSSLHKG